MTASSLNSMLKLDDGRFLGYNEYGAPNGHPLIYFHGLPGSRFEASLWHETAVECNVRIVAPDRPGMGLSTRKPDRTLRQYPSDIAELIAHTCIGEFSIVAVSGGGMYALVCAAEWDSSPELQAVGVVAGLGPRDLSQRGMGLGQRLSYVAMDWVPRSFVGWLWDKMIGKAARDPDDSVLKEVVKKSMQAAPGPDKKLFEDEVIVDRCTDSIRGAFAQGSGGYVDDATIVTQPWGFDLSTIRKIAVTLWYGESDQLAPCSVGRAIAGKIRGAKCVVLKESHMGITLRHQQAVLQTLTQLSDL